MDKRTIINNSSCTAASTTSSSLSLFCLSPPLPAQQQRPPPPTPADWQLCRPWSCVCVFVAARVYAHAVCHSMLMYVPSSTYTAMRDRHMPTLSASRQKGSNDYACRCLRSTAWCANWTRFTLAWQRYLPIFFSRLTTPAQSSLCIGTKMRNPARDATAASRRPRAFN